MTVLYTAYSTELYQPQAVQMEREWLTWLRTKQFCTNLEAERKFQEERTLSGDRRRRLDEIWESKRRAANTQARFEICIDLGARRRRRGPVARVDRRRDTRPPPRRAPEDSSNPRRRARARA